MTGSSTPQTVKEIAEKWIPKMLDSPFPIRAPSGPLSMIFPEILGPSGNPSVVPQLSPSPVLGENYHLNDLLAGIWEGIIEDRGGI